jgi:hypothetical protein
LLFKTVQNPTDQGRLLKYSCLNKFEACLGHDCKPRYRTLIISCRQLEIRCHPIMHHVPEASFKVQATTQDISRNTRHLVPRKLVYQSADAEQRWKSKHGSTIFGVGKCCHQAIGQPPILRGSRSRNNHPHSTSRTRCWMKISTTRSRHVKLEAN